jgi:hypothetical protein
MKILYTKSTPTWIKVLLYVIVNIVALIMLAINLYLGIAAFVFVNWLSYASLKSAENLEKWKKNTLEKDPFFKQNNFSLGSCGQYSLIAVSDSIVRIVNIKSTIRVHRTTYDISEVFKNYPRQGVDLVLNGMNVYYFDIPIAEIKSSKAILQGDAGGFGVLNNLNFGIRITTIKDIIYDIDSPFSNDLSNELNSYLS